MNAINRFLRLPQVTEYTGLRKTAIEDGVKSGSFPQPIKLTDSRRPPVAWLETDIIAWQNARITRSRPEGEAE